MLGKEIHKKLVFIIYHHLSLTKTLLGFNCFVTDTHISRTAQLTSNFKFYQRKPRSLVLIARLKSCKTYFQNLHVFFSHLVHLR